MENKDEIVVQNAMEEYLTALGVEVSSNLEDFNKNKEGYVEVDKKIAGRIDAVLQQVPTLINKIEYRGDVYRVIYNKGIGVLQKSAKYPGDYLGTVIDPSTHKIVGAARLQKLAVGPKIIGGIFNAMSAITGQYFMDQVNHNLKEIEASVESIQKFLEDDKRSKLQSEEEFLKMTQNSLNCILQNEVQKQSTLCSVQTIRIDSLADINFYRMQINDLKDLSPQKDKAEEVIKKIRQICFMISEYWYSLYLYCYALYLEPIVAENYDSDYINMVRRNMEEKCQQYKRDYAKWKKKLEEYIATAKAFEDNKILEALKYNWGNSYTAMSLTDLLIQFALNIGANFADNIDKKVKKKKKDVALGSMNLDSIGENMKAIECRQDQLNLFDMLYNGKLEVIKDHEKTYIKIPEPELSLK